MRSLAPVGGNGWTKDGCGVAGHGPQPHLTRLARSGLEHEPLAVRRRPGRELVFRRFVQRALRRRPTGVLDVQVEHTLSVRGRGPSNARRPDSISKSTAPNEKMSLRASVSRPSTCSGDM